MRVLDIGTGSGGSVAIPAALRGADVVGSDISSVHFDAARARAESSRRRGRVGRGGRARPSLRGRRVRPRPLDLRPHVRARPCTGRVGDGACDEARWRDRLCRVDSGGQDGRDVPPRRLAHAAPARGLPATADVGNRGPRPGPDGAAWGGAFVREEDERVPRGEHGALPGGVPDELRTDGHGAPGARRQVGGSKDRAGRVIRTR